MAKDHVETWSNMVRNWKLRKEKKHELTWFTMAKEHVKIWSGKIKLETITCTNMVEQYMVMK